MDVEALLKAELSKDSVFVNRDYLSPHYIPEMLPFREKQVESVTKILAPFLKGKRPNNMFIYGKVGTGKTCVARKVLDTTLNFGEKQGIPVNGTYINCRITSTKYGVLVKIASKLVPEESLLGFSLSYMFEKIKNTLSQNKMHFAVILDEVDKVKDVDDLIYTLTRMNDELDFGGLSIIGISNVISFKENLDTRTKSTLCEEEYVFPPYNADELREILTERASVGFKPGAVETSALNLAAAVASQESGDARRALMLLLRAGDVADETGKKKVTETEIHTAKTKVEEDLIIDLISTLPAQHQIVLYAITRLTEANKGYTKLDGEKKLGMIFSGEIYDNYTMLSKKLGKSPKTARWYREMIRELETYGLITVQQSGKGIRGHTHLIKMNFDAHKTRGVLEKQLGLED
ncbi:MAG: AAA family ATPase [Candidatus Diapherotrites archaeon]|nr:AAA family ATPase [Candidatus Diapherotrites archaeon]